MLFIHFNKYYCFLFYYKGNRLIHRHLVANRHTTTHNHIRRTQQYQKSFLLKFLQLLLSYKRDNNKNHRTHRIHTLTDICMKTNICTQMVAHNSGYIHHIIHMTSITIRLIHRLIIKIAVLIVYVSILRS